MQQHREARRSFDQSTDRGTAQSQDQISLPMARHRPIGNLGRALTDHDLRVDEGPPWSAGALSRYAQSTPGPQASRQFTTQCSSTLYIQGLIDCLVTDAHRLILREIEPKAPGDLFGTPRHRPASALAMHGPAPLPYDIRSPNGRPVRPGDRTGKPALHIIPQGLVDRQLRWFWALCGSVCMPLCRGRSILPGAVALGGIAPELTRYRARRPVQLASNGSYAMPLRTQNRNLLTLGERKIAPGRSFR